ncbi:MAG: SRPBCC domain-containing protein [Fimbriimonadaceae bacterium]
MIEIRVERIVKAPRLKVWNALTTHQGWAAWFGDEIKGEFVAGQTQTLVFGKETICYAVVTEVVDQQVFAYRWHPGEDCAIDKYPAEEMTTVRFELEDHPDGTKIVLTESNFEVVPESRREWCLGQNTQGWNDELEKLFRYVETGVAK